MPETNTITIKDLRFTVPMPYTEGYTLKANEASALNQTLAENLRNNFAKRVETAKEEAKANGGEVDLQKLQSELDEYASTYEFGVRRAGGGPSAPRDPVEREAYNIAREKIREAAKRKGQTLAAEDINDMIPRLLEKNPSIREQARVIVATRSEVAIEEIELPEETGEVSEAAPSDSPRNRSRRSRATQPSEAVQ